MKEGRVMSLFSGTTSGPSKPSIPGLSPSQRDPRRPFQDIILSQLFLLLRPSSQATSSQFSSKASSCVSGEQTVPGPYGDRLCVFYCCELDVHVIAEEFGRVVRGVVRWLSGKEFACRAGDAG